MTIKESSVLACAPQTIYELAAQHTENAIKIFESDNKKTVSHLAIKNEEIGETVTELIILTRLVAGAVLKYSKKLKGEFRTLIINLILPLRAIIKNRRLVQEKIERLYAA